MRIDKKTLSHNVNPLLAVALFVAAHSLFGQADSLILSPGTTASNGTASLNLNLASPAGNEPVSIQWTVTYSQSDVSALSPTAGPAVTEAGKTLHCLAGRGTYTCVASGMNATTIQNGAVAFVDLTMAAGTSATSIGLSDTAGSSGSGGAMVVVHAGSVVTAGIGPPALPFPASAEFNDVPPAAGYFDAANLMFEAGVTSGCVAGSTPQTRSFCPDNNVTRGEMAAFIVRAVTGSPTPGLYSATPYFTDVPATNPFFPYIQKMMELGITSGCGSGLFCPADTISRWEMAIFMIRARLALYGAAVTTAATPYFADVPTNVEGNGLPFPFIQRCYEEHVTNGCGTNPLLYCPDESVTRGQMASFLMRALFNKTTVLGPAAPLLTGVSPNAMLKAVGTQITVNVTGVNTNFQTGDGVTVPSGMLDVGKVVVNSATSISATLSTNVKTVPGPQALVVTSGGQNLTLPLAIKVGTY